MSPAQTRRRFRSAALAVAVCLLALAAGAALTLGTAAGRQTLLDAIGRVASSADFRLEMRGLGLGRTWALERLTLGDADGTWLEAEDLRARPVLSELVRGRITLHDAAVGRLDLDRLPRSDQPSGGTFLPALRITGVDAPHIRLGQAVMGREALLSLRGGLDLGPDETLARLRVARLDRAGDHIDLDGRLRLRDRRAALRLDLREAPGGLLHAALAVNGTEGITLRLDGEGPFHDWPVTIAGEISDAATLAGNATLDLDGGPRLALHADLAPGPAWTSVTGLPDGNVRIEGQGFLDHDALHATRLDLRSPTADISGNATWDMTAGTLDARLQARSADLSRLLPAGIETGPAEAGALLRLGPSGLRASARLELRDWNLDGHALPSAAADIALDMPTELDRWQARADIEASTPSLPAGLHAWSANATLRGNASTLALHELLLDSELIKLSAGGTLDPGANLDLHARASLRTTAGQPVAAILESTLRGAMDREAMSFQGEFAVNATELSGLPPLAAELLGGSGRFLAGFDLSPKHLHVRQAHLQARTTATLNGEFDRVAQQFSATFEAALPELALGAVRFNRGVSMDGKLGGRIDAFDMTLAARSPLLTVDTLPLNSLDATAALRGLPGRPSATLKASAKANGQPASLDMRAEATGDSIQFQDGLLQLPGTTLQAEGDLSPDGPAFNGRADLRSTDLRPLGLALGLDLAGKATAQAVLGVEKGTLTVRFEGRGEELAILGTRGDRADLKGFTAFPGFLNKTDMHLDLADVAHAPLRADRLDVRLRGSDEGLDVRLDLSEDSTKTLLKAHGMVETGLGRILVDNAHGTMLGQELRLEAPLDLRLAPGTASWDEARLRLGTARLTTRGRLTPTQADVAAGVRDLNPAMLHPVFPHLPSARIKADLDVQGSPENPDARLQVQAEAIRMQASGMENLPSLNLTGEARLRSGVLAVDALAAATDDARVEAGFSGPVQANLPSVSLRNDAPLAGRIEGHSRLSLLPRFLHLDDQSMEGKCDLDFRIGGTWAEPSLVGTAQVRKGRYENFRSGTVVEAIDLDARADGLNLELNATGTDGDKGRVEARGSMDLDALTYAFDARLDGYRLLRMDLIQGTASGDLNFSRSPASGMSLQGFLTLDPSRVRIPKSMPADVTIIDVREINANATEKPKAALPAPLRVALDLGVHIPARMNVQGRGLDSEWAGGLHIQGSQDKPAVSGEMNLLRGKLEFLDRVFDLTKGSLNFNGDSPPNPFLDVVGEVLVLETQIQVHLTGSARSPRLTLSSVPSLPQDELLALILFGRSTRQISPLQAVRLAQAAAEMTGVGTTPDILSGLKSSLGLQEVEFNRDEDDNTSVGIGGYVGGKYYIRTERSVSGKDKTKVEVQLTPKISVETEIGADSHEGGGVTWKHDY